MPNLWLLALRDAVELVRSRSFQATVGVTMAIVVATLLLLPVLIRSTQPVTRWAVVARNPALSDALKDAVRQASMEAQQTVRFVAPSQAVVVLKAEGGTRGLADARFVIVNASGVPGNLVVARAAIAAAVQYERLVQLGISSAALRRLEQLPSIQVITKTPAGMLHPAQIETESTIYLLLTLLFTSLVMYGQMLIIAVSAEKASRVVEVLLTRTSSDVLLIAKLTGTGLVGLLEMALVGGTLGAVAVLDPATHAVVQGLGVFSLSPGALGLLLAVFVLAYGTYGSIFCAIGASLARPEDARSAASLPTLLLVAAYAAALIAMRAPGSSWIRLVAIFPPLFPFLGFEQQTLGVGQGWLWVLGVPLCLLAGLILLRWAAEVYRHNLVSPAPVPPVQLFRLARTSLGRKTHPED